MTTNIKAAFKWVVPTILILGFAFQTAFADHKHYKKKRYHSYGYHQHTPYCGHGYGYKHRLKHKRHYRQHSYPLHSYHIPHSYGRKHIYRDRHRYKRHSKYYGHRSGYRGDGFVVIYYD